MQKGGPYRVVWSDKGDVVGDREGIDKKAQAVSEAVELRKYIAIPIKVLNAKDACVFVVEPVAR